jgi:hypothetical protein
VVEGWPAASLVALMIDASEHFYDDDPGQGHPDVRTRLKDVSYFFLGNGFVQGAVQFAPGGEGTPLGLLVMNPERFGKKRDALTLDPEAGLASTIVRIVTPRGEGAPEAGNLDVQWTEHHGVPAVLATWSWDGLEVHERFYCPDRRAPRLAREIVVRAASPQTNVGLKTGARGTSAERRLPVHLGSDARTWIVYTLDPHGRTVHEAAADHDPLEQDAREYWTRATHGTFGDPLIDHCFNASRRQLPAVVSRHGRVDAGIWQYNREWVRDQALMALGLVLAGHRGEAAVIYRRLLREFVTTEGATVDSSEVRGADEVELDQNGVLLYALREYVNWTGDVDLVASSWDRITAVADFPLRPEFRHAGSGLLRNSREYWERHRIHGIEPGFELAHQLFVSIGLASAASLARLLGHDSEAVRWEPAAASLRQAMLAHPRFALVDRRGFIKRRRLDGQVQEVVIPRPEAGLPPSVPLAQPGDHRLNPDTSAVLPIAFGFVAEDALEVAPTLAHVERLWNQAWTGGGYGRYDVTSEPDSPGGWPFASIFVARAALEAGRDETAWRVLRWLGTVPGAAAGSWFEFYGPRVAPPFPQVGIVPWTWAEMLFLLVQHVLGVRPHDTHIRLRPRLLSGLKAVTASLPVRGRWLHLEVKATDEGRPPTCRVDGKPVEAAGGEWLIPHPSDDVTVEIEAACAP